MRPHPLDRVFAPRAIAVLGADHDDSAGGRLLRNIAAGGVAGALHAIHPERDAIAGVRCRRSLADVEGAVDLAVLAAPPAELRELVRACGERGVCGAVIPAGVAPGATRDGTDAALARDLLAEAARHGMRLVGPNSVGLARPAASVNATFSDCGAARGSLALVSQSGAICTTVLDWAAAHRIGFSAVASLGDAIDVDFGDVLEYLALDEETRSVLLYVERVRSARSFLSGLRAAARLKPVIVVKAGRHSVDAADPVALAAGADDAFDAALARAGAVRVASIEQMFAAARLLAMRRDVEGNRLAILTNARGPGILAADRAVDLGVMVAPLAGATREKLDALLPRAGSHANPVDLLGDAGPARYQGAVEICQADPNVDAVLAMLAPQVLAKPVETAEALVAASRSSSKPLLACWMGGATVSAARAVLAQGGVPELATPESAVEAFSHLASYRRNQRLLLQVPGPLAADGIPLTEMARDVVRSAIARGRDQLTTPEVRKVLAAFGVRFDVLRGTRVRGAELCVSVERDATFGPVIRFGLGGEGPGRSRERIVALPPLNTAIIRTLIESSPIAQVLSAGGALSAEEVTAVERMLWALSELVCELPELRQLHIQPLVPNRTELVAFDARVAIAPQAPGAGRYDHVAIHPYPSHIRERWRLADGTTVSVRPIRPEDAQMEASFVRNLSQSTKYFRFMVALNELTRELLIRFTQIDYDRELALIALVEREGEEIEIAVARYVMVPDGRSADVAIVVADEWQGRGVGLRLFRMLVDAARARGIPRLEGEMLGVNAPARAMLARLGFTFRRDPESPAISLIRKDMD